MKKLRIALVTLVLLAGAMYFTNPSAADFESWMGKHLEEAMDARADAGLFGGVFNGMFSELGASLGAKATTRKEFHILSTYHLDLGERTYDYVGLFGTFIPLQSNQPIEDFTNP